MQKLTEEIKIKSYHDYLERYFPNKAKSNRPIPESFEESAKVTVNEIMKKVKRELSKSKSKKNI